MSARVIKSFYNAHKQVYGHAFEDQLVEIITLARGRVRGDRDAEAARIWPRAAAQNPKAAELYVRDTVFDDGKPDADAALSIAASCSADDEISGPALIVQHNSTTLVPPGYVATVLSHGDMRVARVQA